MMLIVLASLLSVVLVEPALAPSINPDTFSFDAMLVEVVSDAALFTSIPATLILSAILPDESSLTVTLILLELSLILLAVRPDKMAIAVHFIVQPLTCVLLLITPDVDTFSLDLIHLELSLVNGAIGKCELTSSIFLALEVFTFIDSTIRPSFKTESMLFIIAP